MKTIEQLQFDITCNNRLHTSVQSVERLKALHYSIYIKYFADKNDGFIYNRMNANGNWSWRWFAENGMTLAQIKSNRK